MYGLIFALMGRFFWNPAGMHHHTHTHTPPPPHARAQPHARAIIDWSHATAGRAGDEGWNTLGGLLFTVSISMTPLAVYGVERATGIWPGVNGGSYADYYRYHLTRTPTRTRTTAHTHTHTHAHTHAPLSKVSA